MGIASIAHLFNIFNTFQTTFEHLRSANNLLNDGSFPPPCSSRRSSTSQPHRWRRDPDHSRKDLLLPQPPTCRLPVHKGWKTLKTYSWILSWVTRADMYCWAQRKICQVPSLLLEPERTQQDEQLLRVVQQKVLQRHWTLASNDLQLPVSRATRASLNRR